MTHTRHQYTCSNNDELLFSYIATVAPQSHANAVNSKTGYKVNWFGLIWIDLDYWWSIMIDDLPCSRFLLFIVISSIWSPLECMPWESAIAIICSHSSSVRKSGISFVKNEKKAQERFCFNGILLFLTVQFK